MKIYKVHIKRFGWESDGFEFFLKRMDAKARLDENNAQLREDHEMEEDTTLPQPGNIEAIEFKMTKEGIIDLLKMVASHPDNG